MTSRPYLARNLSGAFRYFTSAAVFLAISACSSSDDSNGGTGSGDPATGNPGEVPVITAPVVEPEAPDFTPPAGATNLYDTLSAAGTFTRLLALSDKAGLADDLRAEASMTLFAPTDDAFAALDAAIGQGVLDTFTVAELDDRLKYHIVTDLALDSMVLRELAGKALEMSNDLPAAITINASGELLINNATVTSFDLAASNGILHIIDTVLTPPVRVLDPNESIPAPSEEDMAFTLLENADYSTLVQLLEDADLVTTLQEDNGGMGWTLFAPSDIAFENSGDDVYSLDANGASELVQLHLYPGRLPSHELLPGTLTMSQGSVEVVEVDGKLTVGGATIVGRDRVVRNGIIHFVDKPLLAQGQ